MRYFAILALYAQLLLWVLTYNSIRSENMQEQLPNISPIASFIERYVRPYIESFNLASRNPVQRSFDVTPETKVIKQKVTELKPFLQDYDNEIDTENKLRLDAIEETTIIEFKPKKNNTKNVFREGKEVKSEVFKKDFNKYGKIRDKIKKALDDESVSDKTKNLLTNTFDGIISQLISGQCSWRSGDRSKMAARKDMKLDSLLNTLENIATEWGKVKRKYLKERNNDYKQQFLLFDEFHEVLLRVINDTRTLLHEYKVNCRLLDGNEYETKDLREGRVQASDNKDMCSHFRLCSDELKQFMADFYRSLNETAVTVFRDFAAMFDKDVNINDSHEKHMVISVINKISDLVALNVSKIFRKETMRIQLNKRKDSKANVKTLKRYIKTATNRVEKHIKKHLGENLRSVRARLLRVIEQDVSVNLDIELGNLERKLAERVCIAFSTCNGRYISKSQRKMFDPRTDFKDANNLYVKIQITMDDELKDTVVKAHKALYPSRRNKNNNTGSKYDVAKTGMDFQKYSNIHVTRTTFNNVHNKSELSTTEMNSVLSNGISVGTMNGEDELNEI